MIDCGTDWLQEVHRLAPDTIVLGIPIVTEEEFLKRAHA
jgi:hypothetical protein